VTNESSDGSLIVVMVEDPGALNFLAPLVDMLIEQDVSLVIFGVGVGARQLSERGYLVIQPPSEQDAEKTLRAYGCNLLIIGTCEDKHTPAFGLVRAARLAGIQTLGVVDAAVNAQFRFRGSSDVPLAHVPDWMIVPDEATADAFDQLGFPRDRISIVGHPARDLARRRSQSLRLAVDDGCHARTQDKYRIVFVSELSDGLDQGQYTRSKDYTLMGRGNSSARTAIVAEELLDALSALRDHHGINSTLVLRLHPKQAKSDLGALSDEFDEVSIGGDPLEVVATSDLVVGMTSMLLLQASDMGLNCLSILPREQEKAWLPDVALGVIPSVTERSSLRVALLNLLLSYPESGIAQESLETRPDAVAAMMAFIVDIHAHGSPNVRG
jgi:hypothetical protein